MARSVLTTAWTAAAAIASFLMTGPAGSEELKMTYMFPETHYMAVHGGKALADAVTKATNGEITFVTYPSGQLGKDYISVLNSGLADISVVIPANHASKMPLAGVAELPVAYKDICEASNKFWHLSEKGGLLYEAELSKLGMHALLVSVLPNYNIVTTSKEITSLDDLKGLKIRASGGAMEQTARALGAVPVQLASSEIYDTLQRGTVDGALYPYQAVVPYSLEKLLKHGLEGPILGSSSVIFAISAKKWDALSEDVKQKIHASAMQVQGDLCKWMQQEDRNARQLLIDKYGYKPHVLSPEETAKWQEHLDVVSKSWATRLDEHGLPGSDILKAFNEADGSAE